MTDLFDLVKAQNINIKEFLENNYNYSFRRNKTICPFHGDSEKSPNFSYAPKLNIVKCMVCDMGGDLINFLVEEKKISKLDACMFILDCEKVPYEKPNETITLSDEDSEKISREQEELKNKNKKRNDEKQKEIVKSKNKAISYMTSKAKKISTFLSEEIFNYSDEITNLFPRYDSKTFLDWQDLYLGYDKEHDSIAILNRILDDKNTCFNIKHRLKYIWDKDSRKLLDTRLDGKWVSGGSSTTYAFPYEFFNQKDKDDKVFIVEGEKDALNLLSYDINVLTLGGVSTSWEEHKNLLKDRTVYIWFDNDNAGYEAAILRYNEIKEVAKEVYIVIFYHINNAFDYKYDISDYLAEKKFKEKEDIYHSIAYSSFKLSTTLIEDMEEWCEKDFSKYYFTEPLKTFRDIKKNWSILNTHGYPKHIPMVQGKMDIKDLSEFYEKFKEGKQTDFYKHAKQEVFQEILPKFAKEKEIEFDEIIEKFDMMFVNYKKMHKHYSQNSGSDIRVAFEKMCKSTDNTLAKYNNRLCVWTGKYFHMLEPDTDDISGFMMQKFMPLAKVDHIKITSQNVKTLYEDVLLNSISLNEIKHYQQEVRKINLLNGTLSITKKGRVTFLGRHSKKDGVTNILEFDYSTDAKALKWEKFLDRVLPNKDDQSTLMQFIGYCFLPNHDYESFLFLYGKSGANGKSVIMDIIRSFFGKTNVSSVQLQDFEGHKMAGLCNKILNIGSEIDANNLKNGQMANLKTLVSPEDSIQVDPKHQASFALEPHEKPKILFSGNAKPKQGLDDAVFRRMLLLNFDSEIKDNEKIRGLSKRFNDEMGGILNLALSHLQVLIKNGSFTKSSNMKENLQAYKESIDPLRTFIKESLLIDEKSMIPKRYLYALYKTYVLEKGNHALSEQKFWNRLKEDMKIKTDGEQHKIEGNEKLGIRPRFVIGLKAVSPDILSFDFNKEEVLTRNINYSVDNKLILMDEFN